MKISAIILIGMVLISIYLKTENKALVVRRDSSSKSIYDKSLNLKSNRILKYSGKTLDPDFLIETYGLNVTPQSNQVQLLAFWATWCPTCKEDLKSLNEIYKNINPQNLKITSVNLDPIENHRTVEELSKSLKINFKSISDPNQRSLKAFDLEILPSYVLLKNNTYLYRIEGQTNWTDQKMKQILISSQKD